MRYITKCFFTLLVAALFAPAPVSAAKFDLGEDGKLEIWGLVQVQANIYGYDDYDDPLDGMSVEHRRSDEDGLQFDAERARFDAKYKVDEWEYGLQLDLKDPGSDSNDGSLPDFIRDVYGAYKFSNAFKVKFGQFKMPNGMSYTMSGTRLPLVERTFNSRLVVNRTLGFMVSGRYLGGDKETGGFGYDFAIANPADRSAAFADGSVVNDKGDDHTYVGRLVYDFGESLHLETSYAVIEDAGAVARNDENLLSAELCSDDAESDGTQIECVGEDYEVFDIGALYQRGPVRVRAEYTQGEDAKGIAGFDESAWFLEAGYRFHRSVEGVVRYQKAECDFCDGKELEESGAELDQELSRFEVGANFFFGRNERNGRIQVYYAVVGDDEEAYQGLAKGSGARFATDQIAAQLQMRF